MSYHLKLRHIKASRRKMILGDILLGLLVGTIVGGIFLVIMEVI